MIPLRLKPPEPPGHQGVGLSGLSTPALLAVLAALPIWEKHGAGELVITSVNDSHDKHVMRSKHHRGDAVDLRTSNFPDGAAGFGATQACKELAAALGRDFDVVQKPSHCHVEYDPRRPG